MRGLNMKLQFVALVAVGVAASAASATTEPLQTYLSSGGSTTLIYTGNGTAGFTGQQTVGNFAVSDVTVTSNQPVSPTPSSAAISGLGLNITNTSDSQATLDIYVSDNGFTFPSIGPSHQMTVAALASSFSTSGAGVTDGISMTVYADPSGTIFGTSGPSSTGSFLFVKPTQLSSYPGVTTDFNFTPNYPTPYAITDKFAITLSAKAQTTFTFYNSITQDASPTPEPASMALMGIAGAGVLLLGRRHKSVR